MQKQYLYLRKASIITGIFTLPLFISIIGSKLLFSVAIVFSALKSSTNIFFDLKNRINAKSFTAGVISLQQGSLPVLLILTFTIIKHPGYF